MEPDGPSAHLRKAVETADGGGADLLPESGTASRRPFVDFLRDHKGWIVFLSLLILYNATLKINFSNDCTPNMYLPLAVIRHGSVSLRWFPSLFAKGIPYYLYPYGEGYYSVFGVGTALMAVPFYLPVALFRESPSHLTLLYLSKFTASFYAALSAALLFAALRRLTDEDKALLVAGAYALATPVFCTSSQALWTHAPSLFLLAFSLYLLVNGLEKGKSAALCGLPLGLSVTVRTTNLVFVAPFLLFFAWRRRSQLPYFLLALLPGAVLTGVYNHFTGGAFYMFPQMARMKYFPAEELYKISEAAGLWKTPFWTGFFGNLVSPSRGIFFTVPLLLVVPVSMVIAATRLRRADRDRLALYSCCALAFLVLLLLVSKKTAWTGGESFGNRLLIDALPFLFILLVPVLEHPPLPSSRAAVLSLKTFFVALLVLSLAIQVEGIVSYDGGSWTLLHGTPEKGAWSLGECQVIFYLENPQPVVPPLIKKITGKPARMEDLRLVEVEGNPAFSFHLSEMALVGWWASVPRAQADINLVTGYFAKGWNLLVITDEDLEKIKEDTAFPGGIEDLRKVLFEESSHFFEVQDPLTGVTQVHLLEEGGN
jgi:hypothetical protein